MTDTILKGRFLAPKEGGESMRVNYNTFNAFCCSSDFD